MQRATLLSLIHQLLTDMRPLTLESGVTVKKYEKMLCNAMKCTDVDQLLNLENWLREARDGVHATAARVKARHPQEVWDRYKNLGFTSLNEVVLLGKTLKDLRTFWKDAYNVKLDKNQKYSEQVFDKTDKSGDESSN